MSYVDGYIAAVPTADKEKVQEHFKVFGEVAKENGALEFVCGWGDDVSDGEVTSFPLAVQKKDDETVVFSWMEWPDKATRDANLPKVLGDPRHQHFESFDASRAIGAGFGVILKL